MAKINKINRFDIITFVFEDDMLHVICKRWSFVLKLIFKAYDIYRELGKLAVHDFSAFGDSYFESLVCIID